MPLTSLKFTNIGPFDDVAFEFDAHVNVFVGPNNSGKSTALLVLGELVTYPFTLPTKLLKGTNAEFEISVRTAQKIQHLKGLLPLILSSKYVILLRKLGYTSFMPALRQSSDFRSKGPVSHQNMDSSHTSLTSEQPQELLAIRSVGAWLKKTGRLEEFEHKIAPITKADLQQELRKREALIKSSAASLRDEAVIQKIIELDYAAYRHQEPARRDIIKRIGETASEITEGFPVHFLGVGEDENGLFPQFETLDGAVPLNVLSQGTQSIIQWLAHLLIGYAEYYDYPRNLEDKPGVLIIDEIDAHLHPSWQRRIIPTLTKYFPNLQIFCSTHSPLMLAGLKAGQVHLLKRDKKGKVMVSRNEEDIMGWSSDEILRSFLDIPDPTDLETTNRIRRLETLSHEERLSAQETKEFARLRKTVSQDLLGGPMGSQAEHLNADLKRMKARLATRGNATSSPSNPAPKRRKRSTSAAKSRKSSE